VSDDAAAIARPTPWSGELLYGLLLFIGALVALGLAQPGNWLEGTDWPEALFFLVFGLFTISIGYEQPKFGYVSFDRVAQVSSILVLGPVEAAWINGLASLIYPWHRLRKGVPLRAVVSAALINSGLMTLMVLAGGLMYVSLGGPLPLAHLDAGSFGIVLLMLLAMQVINEGAFMALVRIRGQAARDSLSLFDTATELTAGLIAVLVAITWNSLEVDVLLLLLVVLVAGMLALKRFAEMRFRLERLVAERTEALQDKTRQLEELAARDTLTGLYNRRRADEFLQHEIARAKRTGHPMCVALADIDHFKQINDGHSHGIGDRVLERVSKIFAERMRESDLVARYGGEEFLFCFVGATEVDAARVCEELRHAVEREDWDRLVMGLRVTMSVGIAACEGESEARGLLDRVDRRLYDAKRLGRNRVVARAAQRDTEDVEMPLAGL
jgi:diguanylate cyclase (GGDEF)-like protein